jgi:hypothetical protein
MKKIVAIVVLAIFGGAWFWAANKFGHEVNQKYLPIIESEEVAGLVKLGEVKVQKYQFKIVLKDIKLFTDQKAVETTIDEAIIHYNFLTDSISVCSTGQKILIGSGKSAVYIQNPGIHLKVSRALVDLDLKRNFDFVLNIKPTEIIRSDNNLPLVSFNEFTTKFSSKLEDKESYKIKFKNKVTKLATYPGYSSYKYGIYQNFDSKLLDSSTKKPLDVSKFDTISDILDQINSLAGPEAFEVKIKLSANQEDLKQLKFLKYFAGDGIADFKFAIDVEQSNDIISQEGSIKLSSSDKMINYDISTKGNTLNQTAEKQEQLSSALAELLAKSFALEFGQDFKLNAQDFKPLIDALFQINNSNCSLKGFFKPETQKFKLDFDFGINEEKLSLALDEQALDIFEKDNRELDLKISDPAKFISESTKFTKDIALPLINKIGLGDIFSNIISDVVANIENNGFDALKVLNKNSDLKEGESFEMRFEVNDLGVIKINDKSIGEILADPRVVKFLNERDK